MELRYGAIGLIISKLMTLIPLVRNLMYPKQGWSQDLELRERFYC